MAALRASLARSSDLDGIHALLAAAGAELARHGFANWDEPHTNTRLMLRPTPVHPYHGIEWHEASATARYVNRLAVDPARQGHGIGGWCLSHIASWCTGAGVQAIRCDVLTASAPPCRFYERAGYAARGTRSHSGWESTVYEKRTTEAG